MRTGQGFDAHRLVSRSDEPNGVRLGGVEVDPGRAVVATSDGDVLTHAICDALLGAAALGDVGEHFPPEDPRWQGADSLELLRIVLGVLRDEGWRPVSIDTTVVAEHVRVAPHRSSIRRTLAEVLDLPEGAVSVKATTTDGLGYLGRGEGLAAMAIAVVEVRGATQQ